MERACEQRGRILLGGASYGLHNIGDEAILESMIESFEDAADIDVMSFGSEWIDERHAHVRRHIFPTVYSKPRFGLIASPRKRLAKAVRESFFPDLTPYRGKRLFLCGGGTLLSDCPWQALHMVELAAKAGTPTVVWGAGMAEIADGKTISLLRRVLNSAHVLRIYTRDEYVRARLIRYGIDPQKTAVCYDPAYRLQPDLSGCLSDLTAAQRVIYSDERPNICVCLSGEPDVKDRHHVEVLREFIRQISKNSNVFLIPTGFGSACRDRDIMKTMVCSERVALIDREISPKRIMGLLKNMNLIISSRLHMSIFGVSMGVPSINLIRNEKQVDFAALFDFPALYPHELTLSGLHRLAGQLMSDREKKQQILDMHAKICSLYSACCDEVKTKYII